MKRKFLFALPVLAFAVSCHTGSKNDSTNSSSTPLSTLTSAASDMADHSKEMEQHVEELKKLTPLTNDQLKSFFPETLMDMKRSSFDVNNTMGYAIGTAEYSKDDTTKYNISIYDCAGEAGSAFYGMSFLTRMTMEHEDDNGYTKSADFMGSKGIEEYKKGDNTYTESFVTADRFWVTLSGQNTGIDALKDFAKSIDLDKLKDLK